MMGVEGLILNDMYLMAAAAYRTLQVHLLAPSYNVKQLQFIGRAELQVLQS